MAAAASCVGTVKPFESNAWAVRGAARFLAARDKQRVCLPDLSPPERDFSLLSAALWFYRC